MLLSTFLQTIKQRQLLLPESSVVVGVSGGADSLALLHLLKSLSVDWHFSMHVATLDHGLRGDAGVADARFVEALAREWRIPVTVGQADVPQLSQNLRIGMEAAARKARYDFLAAVAHEIGASYVAVGHHADDLVETVFMHIIRGTGMRGLRGMAFKTVVPGYSDLSLIRPLLDITRADIVAYCVSHGLEAREDQSNADPGFLRNDVRLNLLPLLRQHNPQINHSLTQLAAISRMDYSYIQSEFQKKVLPQLGIDGLRVTVDRKMFVALHSALKRRVVQYAFEQLVVGDAELGYEHIVQAVKQALHGKVGSIAQLPGAIQLRVDYQVLAIEKQGAPQPGDGYWLIKPDTVLSVKIPGVTHIPEVDWRLNTSLVAISDINARLAVPAGAAIILRTRQPGDHFAPSGMEGHHKKLKDWMIDRKIPHYLRGRIPLLVVGQEIAAILLKDGWIVAEPYRAYHKETGIIYLQVSHSENE